MFILSCKNVNNIVLFINKLHLLLHFDLVIMEYQYIEYITPSSLSLLGIRDLRKLAFAVGVYGYTLYSKNDLIVHIVDVVYGRETPKMEISRGRPSSITKNKLEIINSIIEKIEQLRAEQINFNLQYVASSNEEYNTGFSKDEMHKENIKVEGFVDDSLGVFQIRATKNNVWVTQCFVAKEIVEKFGLRPGMKISGEAKLHISGNYFLCGIDNFVVAKDNFDEMEICKPTKQLVLGKGPFENIDLLCPIGMGNRVLICGDGKTINEWKTEFLMSLKSRNVVLASSYTSPEDVAEFNKKFENVFASCFSENDENQCRNINLAFSRARRIAETDGSCVIVINSLSSTIKAFDSNAVISATTNGQTNDFGIAKLRQYCMAAHNTKNNKSITLVAFAECDNNIQQAIVERISEVFSTKIVCKKEPNSPVFPIDKEKSCSNFANN